MAHYDYERQGTAYDPGAVGYELQGRDAAPTVVLGMTDLERRAVTLLAEAWNAMVACGTADAEAAAHVHALQHAVMARTAQRLHPEIFRSA